LWRSCTPFEGVARFAEFLHARCDALHGIALPRLAEALFEHLIASGCPRDEAGAALAADHERGGARQTPPFVREFAAPRRAAIERPRAAIERPSKRSGAQRQARHRA
jgi:hypothetical protein